MSFALCNNWPEHQTYMDHQFLRILTEYIYIVLQRTTNSGSRISHSMHIVSKYLLSLCHTNSIDYFSESCMCSAFGDPHVLRYSQSLLSFQVKLFIIYIFLLRLHTMTCLWGPNCITIPYISNSRFLEIGDPCMFDVQVNYYKGQKTSNGAAMVEYVLLEMYGMVIQLGPHRQVMVCNLNRNMYIS
jgi:hypothetical protein